MFTINLITQIALARHGKALFDATDADFPAVADQIIADMATKGSDYREIFGLSGTERFGLLEFLQDAGWVHDEVP